nr:ParB N-terminal domain-containing protein [Xanthomonas albilineans]
MSALQLHYRPVDSLIPYARNAKQHSQAQVAQIAASIREFGWGAPILIDGHNNVIAGHGRLLAARQLGMAEVPVVPLDHLSDTQRRALILADNKIGENAAWDDDLLGIELSELQDAGFDLDLTGFSPEEWEALIAGDDTAKDGLTDEDNVPDVPQAPISQAGDVWLLGDHRLLCGDATKADDYTQLLGDELPDMAFTDPPYNVNYANAAKDKASNKNRPILNDNLGEGSWASLDLSMHEHSGMHQGCGLHRHEFQRTGYAAVGLSCRCRPLVDLHHLGQEHLHDGPCGLPASVRAHPVRLARGHRSFLVRCPRSRRRLANQETAKKRSASDHETRRIGRARRAQQQQDQGHRARSVRRLRLHAHRLRKVRPARARDRT